MTAYLKDKDFWISIKIILEEWQKQKSDKMLKSAETVKVSEKADDSTTKKSILTHWVLTEKQLKDSEKKNWQKINYLAVIIKLILLADMMTW